MKLKTRVVNLRLIPQGKVIMLSKIEFKNKFAEIAVLSFGEVNDNTPEKQPSEVFCKNRSS